MKSIAFIFVFFFSITIFAQQSDMPMKMEPAEKPVTLLYGLGSLHHATDTKLNIADL